MRNLIIEKYKSMVEQHHNYLDSMGWGDSKIAIPDLDSMADETLLHNFLKEHMNHCSPKG